ncbi:hypothetical protein FH972_021274 [Carpinus fangiana]|uniref:YTH domain-containing family protein n=1 Tax=Carpinus fangiana TaxID=176857 RepID=A0A5N6KPH0_9ROSI|nr:hypothetical protein FH972_021274 [Carpinus fangiana]
MGDTVEVDSSRAGPQHMPVLARSPTPSSGNYPPNAQAPTFYSQYVSLHGPAQQPISPHLSAYPTFIPATQAANPMNMAHMARNLPRQPPNQPYYVTQPYFGRSYVPHPSMTPNFTPSTQHLPTHANSAITPHTGLPNYSVTNNGPAAPYPTLQSYQQHNNYYAPGASSTRSYQQSIPPLNTVSPPQGQYTEAPYDIAEMGMNPATNMYGSAVHQSPAAQYSVDLNSVPRGPPRKPRQSGHALWVGNLPPGAAVVDLKDHFSREATHEIESVKLISKSNCAFVNYKSQAACAAAMQRFHDSRFHGIRLVCRLRRTSAPGASGGSTPAGLPDVSSRSDQAVSPRELPGEITLTSSKSGAPGADLESRVSAQYFILKSLTLQDLETSKRNGIWATQAHNEEALNAAYESADNVYLIFSANKSGEYFGYARMSSIIPAPDLKESELNYHYTSPTAAIAHQPGLPIQDASPRLSEMSSIAPLGVQPRSIPTPATDWAPRGHIIDDSARGTIFWEAEDMEEQAQPESNASEETLEERPAPMSTGNLSVATATQPSPPSPPADSSPPVPPEYPIIACSPIDPDPASISHLSTSMHPSTTSSPTQSHARSAPSAAPPPTLQHQSSSTQTTNTQTTTSSDEAQSRGNPFRVEWISTRRVPFYRTRGLRNALNNNREIKIARDGTQVESSVGAKLLLLFRGSTSAASGPGMVGT